MGRIEATHRGVRCGEIVKSLVSLRVRKGRKRYFRAFDQIKEPVDR